MTITPLWRGMRVGIPCPSYRRKRADLERGCDVLASRGLVPQRGLLFQRPPSHSDPYARLASRANELVGMLRDPDLGAVWMADGGAGSVYLLPELEAAYRAEPWPTNKTILGFSDATAILLWLAARGHPCFYAQNITCETDVDETDLQSTLSYLMNPGYNGFCRAVDVMKPGFFGGYMLPGCLSLHAALRGTPYEPDYTRAVLCLEEHGPLTAGQHEYLLWEKLIGFELAGTWSQVRALLWGDIEVAGPYEDPEDVFMPLPELLEQADKRLTGGQPQAMGAPWGNSGMAYPLPFRAWVEGKVEAGELELRWKYPQAWLAGWVDLSRSGG